MTKEALIHLMDDIKNSSDELVHCVYWSFNADQMVCEMLICIQNAMFVNKFELCIEDVFIRLPTLVSDFVCR